MVLSHPGNLSDQAVPVVPVAQDIIAADVSIE
jgi:hypothetical protein